MQSRYISYIFIYRPTLGRASPSGRNWGNPPITQNIGFSSHVTPSVLPYKCCFCNFHAAFGHFAQIVPAQVEPTWETLLCVVS